MGAFDSTYRQGFTVEACAGLCSQPSGGTSSRQANESCEAIPAPHATSRACAGKLSDDVDVIGCERKIQDFILDGRAISAEEWRAMHAPRLEMKFGILTETT